MNNFAELPGHSGHECHAAQSPAARKAERPGWQKRSYGEQLDRAAQLAPAACRELFKLANDASSSSG